MKFSQHFDQAQAEFSSTAKRLRIDNKMDSELLSNAVLLANSTLEPIYNKICKFRIDSWFRSPELNKAVGGTLNPPSQHMQGKAVDIVPIGMELYEFFDKIMKSNIPFDQLILEFNWCHISYNGSNNRRNVLKAYKIGNKTMYQNLC